MEQKSWATAKTHTILLPIYLDHSNKYVLAIDIFIFWCLMCHDDEIYHLNQYTANEWLLHLWKKCLVFTESVWFCKLNP